jgi:hypothetical protein
MASGRGSVIAIMWLSRNFALGSVHTAGGTIARTAAHGQKLKDADAGTSLTCQRSSNITKLSGSSSNGAGSYCALTGAFQEVMLDPPLAPLVSFPHRPPPRGI